MGQTQVPGANYVGTNFSVQHFPTRGVAAQGQFVHSVVAVNDDGVVRAEQPERLRHLVGNFGVAHADELAGNAGRVGHRAEHVEHGADTDFPADGSGVAHGGMVCRREHEADADFPQATFHGVRRQFDPHAQGFQHVGAAAVPGSGAVAVLGDGETGSGNHESRGGGDVEGAFAIPAGAAGVNGLVLNADAQGLFAHHGGKAGDLLRGFALEGEGGQVRTELGRGRLALHDLAHYRDRVVHGKGFAGSC